MAKKKAFSKGGAPSASNAAKGVFKVSSVQHKKKAKAVKTQIKKVNLFDLYQTAFANCSALLPLIDPSEREGSARGVRQ